MIQSRFEKILTIIFSIAILFFLIKIRTNIPNQKLFCLKNDEQTCFKRNDTFKTFEKEVLLQNPFSKTVLFLDKNTEIYFKNINEQKQEIFLKKGRIALSTKKRIDIETPKTISIVNKGDASFVNYDWKNLIQIIPFQTQIDYKIKDDDKTQTTSTTISVTEFPKMKIQQSTFTIQSEHIKNFYSDFFGLLNQ